MEGVISKGICNYEPLSISNQNTLAITVTKMNLLNASRYSGYQFCRVVKPHSSFDERINKDDVVMTDDVTPPRQIAKVSGGHFIENSLSVEAPREVLTGQAIVI